MAYEYDPARAKYIELRLKDRTMRLDYGNLLPLAESLIDEYRERRQNSQTGPEPPEPELIDLRPYGIDKKLDRQGTLSLLERLVEKPDELFREELRRASFAEQLGFMLASDKPGRHGPQ